MDGLHQPTPPPLKIVPYQDPALKQLNNTRKRKGGHGESANTPPSKIRHACTACREKKTRCSGHEPCMRCQQHGYTCRYMKTTLTTAHDDEVIQNHIDTRHSSASLSIPHESGEGPEHHSLEETSPSQSDHGSLASTHHAPETPQGILQEDQYGHMHGGSSEFAFLQFAKQKLSKLPSISIHFSDDPFTGPECQASVLPPKHIADELVRNFFDFGLTTSRFVHEPSLMNYYNQLYGIASGTGLGQDNVALVYMVLALGSHYSKKTDHFRGYNASVRLYKMAAQKLRERQSRITLSCLQADLLAIHFLLNHSNMHEAWSSFGTLVRRAQALGLHRLSNERKRDLISYEYGKRLFWTIYVNDRTLSSIFGRPCAIHDDDVDQEECAFADDDAITASSCIPTGPEEFSTSAALIYYARLGRILGRIQRELYSGVSRVRSISQIHDVASEIEKDLSAWLEALPPYLNFVTLPPSAMSTIIQRQMCTLKLTFAHASLLLYRPFILYWLASDSREQLARLEQWVLRCHEKSIEMARMIVAECNYLYQRGLFSRAFWMVNYVQFAAIGTIYMCSHLWPNASSRMRAIADEAMIQFPVGVDGDAVGQRYLNVLRDFQEITRKSSLPSGLDQCNPGADHQTIFSDEVAGFGGSVLELDNSWGSLFFDTSVDIN